MNPLWTPPTIETDRLILRAVEETDAEAVFAACSNPNVTRFTLFDTHTSLDDALNFYHHYAVPSYSERVPDPFAVVLQHDPDPRMVGSVGCHWVNRGYQVMELGYWLAEPLWGRGIAAEAARAVVGYTFESCPVTRIQAQVLLGNAASGRVLEKLGFRYEGVLRSAVFRRGAHEDVMLYSVLKESWRR